jgi:ATP-dependent DNA ligase
MDSCFPQRLPLRRLGEPEKKRTQWALTQEDMKNCVWLKPKLVAQIEFAEWTPDGHLRHSILSVGEKTKTQAGLYGKSAIEPNEK